MEPDLFIKSTEDFIYKAVAKSTNILFGKNKTAALSTGLFLKVPIEISVEQTYKPIPKLYKELDSFCNYFSAYTVLDNTTTVYFKFMYHTEKDLKAITNHLHRHEMFFGFVYMHELQHILRKHITSSYNNMMLKIAGDIDNPHYLINIAEDHAINYSLKDLFKLTKSKPIMAIWDEIEKISMYDSDYHDSKMSDIDILKDLLTQEPPKSSPISDNMCEVSFGGNESIQPLDTQPADNNGNDTTGDSSEGQGSSKGDSLIDKCSTASDDRDQALADLADSLKEIITTNTKGSEAGDLFNDLFESIKVNTSWFKKIKASFKRQVYYMTHDFTTSWSNINNTYRHIYKSPKRNFIDDKVEIILSVDHSGSVGTQELQRLLYLMETESKKIAKITVLIHDTRVVKTFVVENEFDISKSPDFKTALATRYVVGGTSHEDVFKTIQEMRIPDISKVIYMSFSDNYSDIEQVINKYPIMRKLTNYWICTVNNPVNVRGTNITLI